MSLKYAGSNEYFSLGTAATIDDLPSGGNFTCAFWFKLTSDSNWLFLGAQKTTSTNGWNFGFAGAGDFYWEVHRNSGNTWGATSGARGFSNNVWTFAAFTYDDAASPETSVWTGTLSSIVAEVDYTGGGRTDGSGTYKSAQSSNVLYGARPHNLPNGSINGLIAWGALWTATLSLSDLKRQQYSLAYPVQKASCKAFHHLGFHGTGTHPDWSGSGHSGTTANNPVKDSHVPIAIPELSPAIASPSSLIWPFTDIFTGASGSGWDSEKWAQVVT